MNETSMPEAEKAEASTKKNETIDYKSFKYVFSTQEGRPFEQTNLYEKYLQGSMVRFIGLKA
jgi:ABC-type ATPase with predicted acetyltransferase domain